ncbi:MAG: hypothetical protein ACP5MG_05975 [Verrucomicrobiia bacterium]|jgi:hypothetical protein
MAPENKIGASIFKEEQRFSVPVFVIPMLLITLFVTYLVVDGMYKQLVQGIPWGNHPMSNSALKIVGPLIIAFVWGVFYLFVYMRLIVVVGENALLIYFRPFIKKLIEYEAIQSCEAVQYKPIREFGGWGIRYRSGETAYTVSGDCGVRLHLKNGKKILIGSHQSERLSSEIRNKIKK